MEKEARPPVRSLESVVRADFPAASEILVSFPHHWEHIATLRANGALYIGGFPVDCERPRPDHFPGLPRDVNLALDRHQLFRFFEPRPTPTIIIERSTSARRSAVIGTGDLRMHLHPIGQAQAWNGGADAVLWECYLYEGYRRGNWVERLADIWRRVETSLSALRIYTPPHEPTFEEGYEEFLMTLGYARDTECPKWWSLKRG